MQVVSESPFLFHRSVTLCEAVYGVVTPIPLWKRPAEERYLGDDEYENAYEWLYNQCGFWPLFLSVGGGDCALWNTGYDYQWSKAQRKAAMDENSPYRQNDIAHGNKVMFAWKEAPPGAVFTDYDWWCCVMCSVDMGHVVDAQEIKSTLKKSWSRAKWLRYAKRRPGSVQAVVPSLDYSTADEVWCRNKVSREKLIAMGFAPEKVVVKRLRRSHSFWRV